ncbi:hypothetical protein [Thiohalobacter sp.]|nr:hypothetical protein [Thiohalobacter sp.]
MPTGFMILVEDKRKSNIRLALILGAIALGVFALFIWSTAGNKP